MSRNAQAVTQCKTEFMAWLTEHLARQPQLGRHASILGHKRAGESRMLVRCFYDGPTGTQTRWLEVKIIEHKEPSR